VEEEGGEGGESLIKDLKRREFNRKILGVGVGRGGESLIKDLKR